MLSPIVDELSKALLSVVQIGYGTVTIRVEGGTVRRITVKASAATGRGVDKR